MITNDSRIYELCEQFLENPDINPETGERMIRNRVPYNMYVNLCKRYGYDLSGLEYEPTSTIELARIIPKNSKLSQNIYMKAKTSSKLNSFEQNVTGSFTGIADLDEQIILNLDIEQTQS